MSLSTRPKRRAATKVAIVELSDSDENEEATPEKRKRTVKVTAKEPRVRKEKATVSKEKKETKPRKPRADKKSKEASRNDENTPPNVETNVDDDFPEIIDSPVRDAVDDQSLQPETQNTIDLNIELSDSDEGASPEKRQRTVKATAKKPRAVKEKATVPKEKKESKPRKPRAEKRSAEGIKTEEKTPLNVGETNDDDVPEIIDSPVRDTADGQCLQPESKNTSGLKIELSDSDDSDEGASPRKRQRTVKVTEKKPKAGKEKATVSKEKKELKPRKPRAEKRSEEAIKSEEKTPLNVMETNDNDVPEIINSPVRELTDNQYLQPETHDTSGLDNESMYDEQPRARVQGRNSFWARRKVWTIDELLAETADIDPRAARNIVQLFENENTIPFICRYRRDLVDHIEPEKLRDIKNSYTEIVNLRKKAETIVIQLEKENVIDEEIRTEMLCAKTTEELEFLYAPYKPASKGSLAERAKALGLEQYADRLLYGELPQVSTRNLVDRKNPDMDTEEKVITGICNIISHNISKHTGVLEELRRLQKVHRIVLKTSKVKNPTGKDKDPSKPSTSSHGHGHGSKNDASKYETYYDYQNDVRYMKPHQILAINRAEKLKFLSVKIIIADYVRKDIERYVRNIFMEEGEKYPLRFEVFNKAFEECYTKKLQPLMTRQIRSDLNESAKKASIDVFAKNLKQLLLMSPLKGERILGIDPGFTNGCKYAAISETADVLESGVMYPHKRNTDPEKWGEELAKILLRHKINIIALGNGTACRETEFWLSKLFELGILDSACVRYSIVSEQGASIYSCSEVAKKEFPHMDMNEISAVSIARRLNDPLSEYVKIEPRHIGVGMYQHDINEKQLSESLNEVVSECVSYVGVDVNTASITVLKHIAGLTEKKAEKIIQYRLENGSFRTRKDLLQVKSIGEKTFVQCAGFIRIDPRSLGGTIENLLDCTWVHPESYAVAKKIISKCKLDIKNIGSSDFIQKIGNYKNLCNMDDLAKDFKTPKERLDVVFQALQRELFKDYRSDFDKRPLFKQGLTKITELSQCDVLTGAITNITHFGAFVDIGVECDGLIHTSNMGRMKLNIGDRVTVSIVQIDVKRKRIGLRLEEMLMETDTSFTFA